MANIPENTTNPILRPVTRLETTTKVFGGEYIPDDAQQRGISNLQAIELAERDQYILSRVGQPYVPASGDIPAKAGIAGLDTSGRVPKTQLPTDTVYTEETQTLKNKTIDGKDNTILATPISIETTQTYDATSSAHKVLRIAANDIVLTLGSAFTGATLTVIAQTSWDRYGYIKYTSGGKDVILAITSQQEVKFYAFNGNWILEGGQTLTVTDSAVTYAPAGEELPNDWRNWYGTNNISFMYAVASGAIYDQPSGAFTVSEIWWYQYQCVATGAIWNSEATTPVQKFTRSCTWGTWQTYWTEVTTNNGTQTLTNKTIDFADNTILNTPTVIDKSYDEPVTLNFTKEQHIVTTGTDPFITIGTAPYYGYEIRFTHNGSGHLYIKFNNPLSVSVCIAITNLQTIKLIKSAGSSRWSVEPGVNLESYDLQNIPTGESPNDYREYLGAGIFSFSYDGTGSTYELPTGENRNSVTVKWLDQYVAYAIDNVYSGKAVYQRLCHFGWQAGWTKFSSDDGTSTLTNKTILATQNKLLNNSIAYSSDTILDFIDAPSTPVTGHTYINGITNITLALGAVITLGEASYDNYQISIMGAYQGGYVIFKNISNQLVCIHLRNQDYVVLRCYSSNPSYAYWLIESGSTLYSDDSIVSNAPLQDDGVTPYLPNNYKDFYGYGTYHITYSVSSPTTYDLPVGTCATTIIWEQDNDATVQAQQRNTPTTGSPIWNRKKAGGTWATFWTRFDGTAGGTGTVHGSTITSGDFANTMYWWSVVNGVCYLHMTMITSVTGNAQTVVTDLPKAKQNAGSGVMVAGSSNNLAWMYINANTTNLIADVFAVSGGNGSFAYPVADDWVES